MKFIPKNNLENPSKIIFSNVRQRVSNAVVKRKSVRSTTCSGVVEQFDSPHHTLRRALPAQYPGNGK